jgi:putative Mg2+ transporter-C (MgtC) family protein
MGAIIGIEREFKDKPAGLRKHMLVAGAAALLVSLGDVVTRSFD